MAGPTKKVGRRVYEAPTTTKGKFVDTKGKYGKKGKVYRTHSETGKKKKYEKYIKRGLSTLSKVISKISKTKGHHMKKGGSVK